MAEEETLVFSLKSITDGFSAELKETLRKPASDHVQVRVPRALIQPQLSAGVVRIPFARLRAAAPEVFFHAGASHAEMPVVLPLETVLRQCLPSRREDQRPPAIPVNVPSVFKKGNGTAAPLPEPPAPLPASPAPAEAVHVPLAAVMASFPPGVRTALQSTGAEGALRIPAAELEAGMQKGQLRFSWQQLRAWATGHLPPLADSEAVIDLPLAVVVPLFLAGRKAPENRKRVEIGPNIPSPFSKTPASAPLAEPATAPASASARAIDSICSLPGVTGAFLATMDGLLIAARVPEEKKNVLAAFAPAVFSQLTRYAEMAQLGSPESITVLVAAGCLQVHKAGKLYLGVLTPRDHPLPSAELIRISTTLEAL